MANEVKHAADGCSIQCPCGRRVNLGDKYAGAAKNNAIARGWKFVVVAYEPEREGDLMFLDGVCPECAEQRPNRRSGGM